MAVHILPTRTSLLVGHHCSDVYIGTAEELVAVRLARLDELPPPEGLTRVTYDPEGKVVSSGTNKNGRAWRPGARRIERMTFRGNRFRITVCVDKHAPDDSTGAGGKAGVKPSAEVLDFQEMAKAKCKPVDELRFDDLSGQEGVVIGMFRSCSEKQQDDLLRHLNQMARPP